MDDTERAWRHGLQSRGHAWLAEMKSAPPKPITVRVEDELISLELRAAQQGTVQLEGAEVLDGYFSALERQIVKAIGRGKVSGKLIGGRTQLMDGSGQANPRLRLLLSNLCDRGLVESDDGYTLTTLGIRRAEQLGLIE